MLKWMIAVSMVLVLHSNADVIKREPAEGGGDDIAELQRQINALQEFQRMIETKEAQMLEAMTLSSARMDALEAQSAETSTQLGNTQGLLSALGAKIQQRFVDQQSYFMACIKDSKQIGKEVIKFDQVLSQSSGNNYDASTGTFTCPKSAIYFFSATIIPPQKTTTQISFNMDGNALSQITGVNMLDGISEVQSFSMSVQCLANQKVSVKSLQPMELAGVGRNCFNGHLVNLLE